MKIEILKRKINKKNKKNFITRMLLFIEEEGYFNISNIYYKI